MDTMDNLLSFGMMCEGDKLARSLGGAENLFNVFDITPTNGRVNIKYGSIKLINKIHIMNSVSEYGEFIEDVFSTTERKKIIIS